MSDAKVLTTKDVEALQAHADEDGGIPGAVLVDRDELLATTLERDELRAALQRAFQWVPDEMVIEMEAERVLAFGKD